MELKQLNEMRAIRGHSIIAKGVNPKAVDMDTWLIPSQTTNEKYLVRNNGSGYTCECPDFTYRHLDCKHIYATKFWLKIKEKIRQQETIEIQEELANRCVYCYSKEILQTTKKYNISILNGKDIRNYFMSVDRFDLAKSVKDFLDLNYSKWKHMLPVVQKDAKYQKQSGISESKIFKEF